MDPALDTEAYDGIAYIVCDVRILRFESRSLPWNATAPSDGTKSSLLTSGTLGRFVGRGMLDPGAVRGSGIVTWRFDR